MAEASDNTRKALLTKVFGKDGRKYLDTLQGHDAESVLDMMQTELHEPTGMFHAGKILKAMKTLSSNSGKFPPRYWLTDVKCGEQVACGGNGDIYKGDRLGTSVAVKFSRYYQPEEMRNAAGNALRHKAFCHEVIQWHRLSDPNILGFLGLYQELEGPRVGMVSKWQKNGDLGKYLKQHPGADRYALLIQATEGLVYLHEQKPSVVHMDLKPENILISDTGTAMLADFGCSRTKHGLTNGWSSTRTAYTALYASPEVILGSNEIQVFSDIWSLGMVVFAAFTGETPYPDCPLSLEKISKAIPPQRPPLDMKHRDRGFTDDLWILLEQSCWAKTERHRPSARDCSDRLKHLKCRWESDKRRISEICLPVMPQYARDRPKLCSKMEQFDIKLDVYEGFDKLKLQGKEDNVLAAKAEILSEIESLKNVITKTVSIPTPFHARLIGVDGKSVKAMEQRYSVKIKFYSKNETVDIQGAPHDVSAAKNELLSKVGHLDFREIQVTKDVSNLVHYNRMEILSKLRLQKLRSASDTVIYMEGPKKALNDGQTYVRELQEYLEQEVREPIEGDTSLLRQIFNEGSWRELVTECGGPSDPVLKERLIIPPLAGDPYYLRAAPNVLQVLIPKLQLEVERRCKTVIGVEIPQDLHKSLLREHPIDDIQRTTDTSIFFPHSKHYQKFDCENDIHLTGNPENIVKIHGTHEACDIARRKLEKLVKQERQLRQEIPVSNRLHHKAFKLVLRELKTSDIQITPWPSQPLPLLDEPCSSSPPMGTEPSWKRYNIFEDENDTQPECTWLLRGKTKADLEKGIEIVKDVVQLEMHNSWKGLLTFASNSTFGRVVGKEGETVKSLEERTKTKIDVPKEGAGSTIVITGPRKGVDEAKDIILQLTSLWKAVSNE